MNDRREDWSRRTFVIGAAAASSAGVLGLSVSRVAAEPPPETTTITLNQIPGICVAPQYVAEELLRSEGFTDVRYAKFGSAPVPVPRASRE
jgi:NitT/TauT family transport system substrate-binding protein